MGCGLSLGGASRGAARLARPDSSSQLEAVDQRSGDSLPAWSRFQEGTGIWRACRSYSGSVSAHDGGECRANPSLDAHRRGRAALRKRAAPPVWRHGTRRLVPDGGAGRAWPRRHPLRQRRFGDASRLVPVSRCGLRLGEKAVDAVALHLGMLLQVYQRAGEFEVIHCDTDYPGLPLTRGVATPTLVPVDWPEPFGLVLIEALACGSRSSPAAAARCPRWSRTATRASSVRPSAT